jgi:hypothetical protein
MSADAAALRPSEPDAGVVPLRSLVLLCARDKRSTLDRVFRQLGVRRGLRVESVVAPEPPCRFEPGTLVLVRSSELRTRELERTCAVYPSQGVRERARNKWLLHEYCLCEGIPTPRTLRASELRERLIFKRTLGSNHSVLDPLASLDAVVQERIAGAVIKAYGHAHAERFVAIDEQRGELVSLPAEVSRISRKVLADHGLLFGGLDWIAADRWYLIDVNATTGLRRVPTEAALPMLSESFELLLSSRVQTHDARRPGARAVAAGLSGLP